MDARKAYIRYVQDVLGARTILQPKDVAHPEEALAEERARTRTGHWPPPGDVDLLILHRGASSYFEDATAELWEKMKAAMKLASARVLEVESAHEDLEGVLLDLLASYPASVSLILSEAPNRSPELRVLGSSKVLESFSPALLLSSPDLKKAAWADLQIVMRSLGQN